MRSKYVFIGILIGGLLSSAVIALAGSLDAPAGPSASVAQMYSLAQIYDRLATGAAGTKVSAFTEPSAGPSVGTMHTLDEIMAVAPTTHTHAATQTQVLSGTVVWGLSEGAWGVITGTRPYAHLPKTGQTTTYSATDDGDLEMGVAWPTPRFTDNGDGTVTDNLTGLIWQKDANCIANQYPGFDNDDTSGDGQVTWPHALVFVAGINAGTYPNCGASFNDWRLPNVRELQSLVDCGEYNPALPDGHPFTAVQPNYYWSSTTGVYSTSHAWGVNLYYGVVTTYNKTYDYYVWPVRGGK